MNPSTALARVLVDELIRGGVREAVLSPGSRSAPLAFALHAAEQAGRLRLHVRIDERSAAFLALGLAKESGRPVPVVTTSGTATANLHPAVLEASLSGVPLLLLTADRPPELRGSGANQTVDQVGLYGGAVRLFVELGVPEERVGQNAYWRSATCRGLAAAGGYDGPPGPVQVNVALRDPLVPSEGGWVEPLDGRPDDAPWTSLVMPAQTSVTDDLPDRTVVVIGDGGDTAAALHLAQTRGLPVVAEPSSGAVGSTVVPLAERLLAAPGWLDAHRPDRVLVVGRPTLSRAIGRLLTATPSDVVAPHLPWPDPAATASRVLAAVPSPAGGVDAAWLESWLTDGLRARGAVDAVLAEAGMCEPAIAAEVVRGAAGLLVVGSSKPVRDLFLAGGREGLRVLANRGVAGIDGMVSTAIGAALAHGRPTVALLGDLTFLHDSNGLVLGPDEPRPDLVIVVVNNDGGAIFGLLEQGAPEHAPAFERVFGTPHGVDLAALCAATATPYALAESIAALRAELGRTGLRVVEVRTDRAAAIALDQRLVAAVSAAVTS
ncbi:MAG: 2-succinyl-5-enolpyruvyl-6-hydroxy-3-cyclohexene-1-carboxylic-acid synthase [Mycobacteriales bacterium]